MNRIMQDWLARQRSHEKKFDYAGIKISGCFCGSQFKTESVILDMVFQLDFHGVKASAEKLFVFLVFLTLVLAGLSIMDVHFGIMPKEAQDLPYFSFLSLSRMFAAYLLSLLFAVGYGYYAATHAGAEKPMVFVLDVLQSVPVLGFFPAAIFFFVHAVPGTSIGIELASVFLIFTGMAWNMVFGVYEAMKKIPTETRLAVESFTANKFLQFERLYLPAAVPNLVYNSMMSWAGGWFFLIACEIISMGSEQYKLEGLGSFLIETSAKGRLDLTALALGVLVFIIIVMDLFLWRPLMNWAEKFRYEGVTISRTSPQHMWSKMFQWSPVLVKAKWELVGLYEKIVESAEAAVLAVSKVYARHRRGWELFKKVFVGLFAIAAAYFALALVLFVFQAFSKPLPEKAALIPAAIFFSFLRLLAAYVIALVWTVPAAVFVAKNPAAQKYLLPIFEIMASVPATAIFPFIISFVVLGLGSMDFAAVFLLLAGVQWYLFFNLLAGVKSLPADLEQAASAYNVRGKLYWQHFLLPAMFPSFVTGSITAWGGGWNAMIIAEYVTVAGASYSVLGIGSLLNEAVYQEGGGILLVLCLLAMIATIFCLNTFVWRRLFNLAASKYKIDQ